MDKIKEIEKQYLRTDLPKLEVGDTVKMMIKTMEADNKVRLHPFEGTVISIRGSGAKASFTVRKISFGEGVERIFPINSPVIESISVVSKGVSKRAKLYYLRDRIGKETRLKQQEAK